MSSNNNVENIQVFIQNQIGKIRKKQSITQEELSSLVKISPKTLSDIENNRRGISMKTFLKICSVLKIDIKNNFNIKK